MENIQNGYTLEDMVLQAIENAKSKGKKTLPAPQNFIVTINCGKLQGSYRAADWRMQGKCPICNQAVSFINEAPEMAQGHSYEINVSLGGIKKSCKTYKDFKNLWRTAAAMVDPKFMELEKVEKRTFEKIRIAHREQIIEKEVEAAVNFASYAAPEVKIWKGHDTKPMWKRDENGHEYQSRGFTDYTGKRHEGAVGYVEHLPTGYKISTGDYGRILTMQSKGIKLPEEFAWLESSPQKISEKKVEQTVLAQVPGKISKCFFTEVSTGMWIMDWTLSDGTKGSDHTPRNMNDDVLDKIKTKAKADKADLEFIRK